MIGTQSMASQVIKTLDLGKPSKNEKKGKQTSARMGAIRATLHQPGYRKKQDRQSLYVAAPHYQATAAHLDTKMVVKAVTSVPVKKTDSDASHMMFVSEIKLRLLVPWMSVEWQIKRPEAPIFEPPSRKQKGEKTNMFNYC
jgi:hypothetical protein